MIWVPEKPGHPIEVMAEGVDEAGNKLRTDYGFEYDEDVIVSIHNDEDANLIR